VAARKDDTVVIGLSEQALVRGSAAVYLVPLLSMVAMALVGEGLAPQWLGHGSETLSIAFALSGLVLGFCWLWMFSRRIGRDPAYQPVVLRRVTASSAMDSLHSAGSLDKFAE
jgi:sigma-E factor negative regulatory protein RseC